MTMKLCRFVTLARCTVALGTMLAVTAVPAALPAAGLPAPDFTLKSASGQNLRLRELRGEVVLINFWATWCGPCRQEMPLLNKIHEQYRKAGFTLLGVNIDDDPAAARDMARKLGVSFPVLLDTDKRVSKLYDVDTMPATLLVDRNGKVRYVHRGYRPGLEVTYQNQIRELLKQ
jgi:peroxiredoxin